MTEAFTTEELEKKWDRFSSIFANFNEPQTTTLCNLLIANLQLNPIDKKRTPKSILEIACGGGAGTELCLFQKQKQTKLTSTDLSGEMIRIAKKRLSIPEDKNGDEERNFTIMKTDAENLPFPDGSFDRYFANFCLHLVNDPDRMLRESYRVLESGGIACFTVWGRVENCNKFTIIPEASAKLGLSTKQTYRSAFHLNDIEKLRSMALAAGFSRVLGGYSSCNDLISSPDDFVQSMFSTPELQDRAKTMEPEVLANLKQEVANRIQDNFNQGKFINFEAAYIVCTK